MEKKVFVELSVSDLVHVARALFDSASVNRENGWNEIASDDSELGHRFFDMYKKLTKGGE